MKCKIKLIFKILFSDEWIVVTPSKRDNESTDYDFRMANKDIIRHSVFIQNFVTKGDETLNEAKEILGL
jgi:hypothetical protein